MISVRHIPKEGENIGEEDEGTCSEIRELADGFFWEENCWDKQRVSVDKPATAFEREVFREALLARSINHQTSARANVLPTNEQKEPCASISPRPVTDR